MGFDLGTHRPVLLPPEERAQIGGLVGFIGQWEPERAGSLRNLAKSGNSSQSLGLYTWERMRDVPPGLRLENQPLWAMTMRKLSALSTLISVFSAGAIVIYKPLGPLKSRLRRFYGWPSEPTEHLRLFEEGTEADFFSSDDELIGKVEYYLQTIPRAANYCQTRSSSLPKEWLQLR